MGKRAVGPFGGSLHRAGASPPLYFLNPMKKILAKVVVFLWLMGRSAAAVAGLAWAHGEGCAVVSHVVRVTSSGDPIEGALYVPQRTVRGETAPCPMFVLSHGFSRDYGRHTANAVAYACAGIITYTPNLVPVDALGSDHERQVVDLVDHVKWLRQRALKPEDPLFGVGDPERIAVGGHSAGGAVSVEALERLQNEGIGISALILLDAVPQEQTLHAAARLKPLPVLSLRSRPGPCNAYGSPRTLEEAFPFPVTSFFIPSATHCDPESPTDILCRFLCGGSSEEARKAYGEKTLAFLKEILLAGASRGF